MDLEHAPWDFMWCLFKEHMENMPLLSSSLLLKLTQLRVKARFLWMLCRILLPPSFLSFSGFLTDVLFLAKLSWNKNAIENFVWESCCFPPAEKEPQGFAVVHYCHQSIENADGLFKLGQTYFYSTLFTTLLPLGFF